MKSKRNSTSARAQGIRYENKLEKEKSKSEMPDLIKNFFPDDEKTDSSLTLDEIIDLAFSENEK